MSSFRSLATGAATPAAAAVSSAKPVFSNNQIVSQLTTSWGGSQEGLTESWHKSIVYYSIPKTAPTLSSYEAPGFKAMTAGQVAAARLAFELWDDVAAISLTENTSTGADIAFAYSSKTQGGGTYTYSYTGGRVGTDQTLTGARVWMNSTWSTHDTDADMYFGGYGLTTYLHEIGHALGLSHPGTYDAGNGGTITYTGNAEYAQDTRQYTVMSYFDADEADPSVDHYGADGRWKYAQTPLLDDILALQAKYGADTTTRTGATTYGFHANAGRDVYDFTINKDPIVAIWDAGGVDTLDVSGFTTNQKVNLNAGTFSDVGYMTKNVAIAFGATIENAVGGAGADVLIGNAVANRLTGGKGADTLSGGAGADVFVFHAGDGKDTVTDFQVGTDHVELSGYGSWTLAQSGADTLVTFSAGDGILLKGVQASTVTAASFTTTGAVSPPPVSPPPAPPPTTATTWDHTFVGTAGSDTFNGTSGKDLIQGLAGGDTLYGLAGNDRLEGGAGGDRMNGGDGNDVLQGGLGNDVMSGGGGADRFLYARGDGQDVIYDFSLSTGDRIQVSGYTSYTLRGSGADTLVTFASGDTLLLKSVAPAQVTATAFVFAAAAGDVGLVRIGDADSLPHASRPELATDAPFAPARAEFGHNWWF